MSDLRARAALVELQRRKHPHVCRRISFGSVTSHVTSSDNIENRMSDLLEEEARRAREKYDFDLLNDRPLPDASRWEYEVGSAHDGTPEFYLRAPHKRPAAPSSRVFRPIQAAADDDNSATTAAAFRTPSLQVRFNSRCRRGGAGDGAAPPRASRQLFPASPSATVTSDQQQRRDNVDDDDDTCSKDNNANTDDVVVATTTSERHDVIASITTPPDGSNNNNSSNSSSSSRQESSPQSNSRKRPSQQSLVTGNSELIHPVLRDYIN